MDYKNSTKAQIWASHKEITSICEKLEDHTKLLEDKLVTAVTEAHELKNDYTEAMESLRVNSRRLINLSEENTSLKAEAREQVEAVLQTQISLNKVIKQYSRFRWILAAPPIAVFLLIAVIGSFTLKVKFLIAVPVLICLVLALAFVGRIEPKDIENANKEHRFYNKLNTSRLRLYK